MITEKSTPGRRRIARKCARSVTGILAAGLAILPLAAAEPPASAQGRTNWLWFERGANAQAFATPTPQSFVPYGIHAARRSVWTDNAAENLSRHPGDGIYLNHSRRRCIVRLGLPHTDVPAFVAVTPHRLISTTINGTHASGVKGWMCVPWRVSRAAVASIPAPDEVGEWEELATGAQEVNLRHGNQAAGSEWGDIADVVRVTQVVTETSDHRRWVGEFRPPTNGEGLAAVNVPATEARVSAGKLGRTIPYYHSSGNSGLSLATSGHVREVFNAAKFPLDVDVVDFTRGRNSETISIEPGGLHQFSGNEVLKGVRLAIPIGQREL